MPHRPRARLAVRFACPWYAVAAALVLATVPACERAQVAATRATWEARWPALARAGRHWRPGVQFLVTTYERGPEGVRRSRERWTLLQRDSVAGDFELVREGLPARVLRLPFHAGVPRLSGPGASRGPGLHPVGEGFVHVHVPQGRFTCGRTWRTRKERDGTVVRVDEWWAPGVPVPVQRWTRREDAAEALHDPPPRAAALRAGTTWSVLEAVRRP
jgi:hypothetical protein